ncbi:hypothetical protein CDD83_7403 [Cordyceps sp. RAO-2017]|nr:hypothetical protein CDD83_7403 [Cordyceps sp. RAO-2017]
MEKNIRLAQKQDLSGSDVDEGDDGELSEASKELDDDEKDEGASDASSEKSDGAATDDSKDGPESVEHVASATSATQIEQPRRERKRKRKDDNDDLEAKYLAELSKDDVPPPDEKRQKGEQGGDANDNDEDDDDDQVVPVHESLGQDSRAPDLERAGRTIFLGNVSTEAITSKHAKKTLTSHLSSVLDSNGPAPEKLESLRFRSVAFSTGSMPKRAAYITKSIMGSTTKSANAYAVFSSSAAARKVVSSLNGSEVLGRHIRVDSVAHPSPMDHRRCVFVGNLEFVDDETVLNTNSEGKTVEKKRNKVPADVEEGLWRTFGKQGKVENVRVVRDPKTRIGKGFAYVQFYDGNDVEAALLLDGKKFPPMLPRALRVTRAKAPHKTALAQERSRAKAIASGDTARRTKYERKISAEEQAAAGRAGKLLGRAGAALQRRQDHAGAPGGASAAVRKSPEQIVFEGRRASAKDGRPKDLKLGKKGKKARAAKPKTRSARRGADWKKKKAA